MKTQVLSLLTIGILSLAAQAAEKTMHILRSATTTNDTWVAAIGGLDEGDTLTIDQVNETVIRETGELGHRRKINEFNNRSKEESVFTPAPIGQSRVNWSGSFYVEITMYKERDEAKWKD